MQRQKLLIDTDPGVDDALAILMAHAQADVLGLTIAAGNVGIGHTLANALKLIDIIGAQTPVFPGCPTALVLPAEDAAFVHGRDGFGDIGYLPGTRRAEAEHAALAPLTNLALALRLDPSLPQRVARLVIMGGAVTGRGNTTRLNVEFNVGFDPEAAHVVFSGWPQFTLVDWELTMRHGIAFERMQSWLATADPRAQFFAAISRKTRDWTRERGRPNLLVADALAMAVALQPGIVTRAEALHVAIELAGVHTRGATVVDGDRRSGRAPNAEVVYEVDHARFESMIAAALGAA
jgi:inosine-uridine nucleoside N-ribohydrolase